uniref:Uncharacterized protein n=1 Tax=Octopus bimaculoides TaxID=37653 RepID=A0A0L8HDB9_OCTBM
MMQIFAFHAVRVIQTYIQVKTLLRQHCVVLLISQIILHLFHPHKHLFLSLLLSKLHSCVQSQSLSLLLCQLQCRQHHQQNNVKSSTAQTVY